MSRANAQPQRAPRWAGYGAALFGLYYAISKIVMAARGELGGLGHPAPPERYERFSGDIVTAQLGNAALGLLTAAIALALVQRWGRRVPAAVLAAGAAVALVSGIAGLVVVATSLTGLRKDHGQWGIDSPYDMLSLVLGLASLAAWLVLTVAAVRAARAEGPPPQLRAVLARGRRAIRGATRPGRRAALAAAVGCAAYGALKLSWALGGELLLRETPLPADARRDLLERTPGAIASHWVTVALAAIGIAVAVATVRDRRLPRMLVVGVPALLAGLMLARAAWGAAHDVAVLTGAADGSTHTAHWDLALWSPFFAAWGAAWSLAALAARRRTAGAPTARRPPPPLARQQHHRGVGRDLRRRARRTGPRVARPGCVVIPPIRPPPRSTSARSPPSDSSVRRSPMVSTIAAAPLGAAGH